MDEYLKKSLEHHGVKGMKWGRRKETSSTSSNKETASEDATRANRNKARAKTSGTDALSNSDLQHLVNRMNLEQQYSRLSGSSKTQSAGSKLAKEILGNVAKQQITKIANDQAAKIIKSAMAGA